MKQFITFIFILTLAVLGFIVARGSSGNPQSAATPSLSVTTSAPSGALYIRQRSNKTNEIQKISLDSGKKTTVFTASDKDLTAQSVSPISSDGTTLLAFSGKEQSPIGKLLSLATDGSNKTVTLSDNFTATPSITLSPDNQKIAYTTGSTDDNNPGTQLVIMDVTGNNKQSITTESMIWGIRFRSDSKTIAYVRNKDDEDQIVQRDLTTNTETILYRSAQAITQFDWSSLGIILIGTGSDTNTSLFLYDPNKKVSQAIPNIDATAGSAILAPDASGVAYQKDDDVIITAINDHKETNYGSAYQIIGWIR